MNRSILHVVLRQVEGLTPGPDGEPDADLLRRFAASRDEPAFAAILRRHGPMVWAVCRHLLPDPADAEDAFQATFLALVRSAGSIHRGAAVGGWLHGVAVKVATKVKRSAVRRKQREQRAAESETDQSVPEATWETLLAAVHEEVRRLPDPLRAAFVLCDLEGVRQPDAATRLGWKAGTLTGRLARARQLLLKRLASRGLAPLVAGGTIGLGVATASGAVPLGLTSQVMQLIRAGGVVPPAILKLAREVMPMTLNRMKLIAVAVLAAGGLTVGVGTTLFPSVQAQPPAVVEEVQDLVNGPAVQPPGGAERPEKPGPPGQLPAAVPGQPGNPGAPAQPPGAPGAPGRPGAMPGPPGGMPGGQGWGMVMGTGRAEWEYAILDKPGTVPEFKKLLDERGKEGWEFCGLVPLHNEKVKVAAEVPMVVFKRSKGRMAAMGGFGGGGFGGAGGGGGFGPGFGPAPGGGGFGGGGGGFPGFSGPMPGMPPGGGFGPAPGGGPIPGMPPGGGGSGPGAGTPTPATGAPKSDGPKGPGVPAGGKNTGGGSGAPGAAGDDASHVLRMLQLKHVSAQDAAKALTNHFGTTVRISATPSTNELMIFAPPGTMTAILEIAEALDGRPRPVPFLGTGTMGGSGGTTGGSNANNSSSGLGGSPSGGIARGALGGPGGLMQPPVGAGLGGTGSMLPSVMSGGMGSGPGGGAAPEPAPKSVNVLRLKHAKAQELVITLNQLYAQNNNQQMINQFNARDVLQMAIDERTNSLILRVDEKTLGEMKKLIEQLDVPEVSPLSPQGGSAPQPLPGGM